MSLNSITFTILEYFKDVDDSLDNTQLSTVDAIIRDCFLAIQGEEKISDATLAEYGRRALRREAQLNPSKLKTLCQYTQAMNHRYTKGFLWSVAKGINKVFILAICHWTIRGERSVSEVIHPIVMKAFNESATLYLECKHDDFKKYCPFIHALQSKYQNKNPKLLMEYPNVQKAPGLDKMLEQLAESRGKAVVSVESAETIVEATRLILRDLVNKEYQDEIDLDNVDVVQQGDWPQLLDRFNEEFIAGSSSESQEKMRQRNLVITKKIVDAVTKGESALFAIGAFHFPEDNGILGYLIDAGMELESIPLP